MSEERELPPIPAGPIDEAPWDYFPLEIRRAVLDDALSGVELGAWDDRFLDWLAQWDWTTVATTASLIKRAVEAGDRR